MTSRLILFTTAASLAAGALNAQQQPAYYQTTACIKVTPGKFTEYRQFVNDTSKKMAEARAKAGEIVSWAFLRSIMPAGAEARCEMLARTRARRRVCTLTLREQPLGQLRPALERSLQPLDLQQVDPHTHSTVTVFARFLG